MNYSPESTASIATHFARIDEARAAIGPIVLPMPGGRGTFNRFVLFDEVLNDWRLVCQRYDSDLSELVKVQARIKDIFPSGSGSFDSTQREFVGRMGALIRALKLDIRSFYIFAKIPLVSYASLLFAMASHPSGKWRSATEFIKALQKPTAPPLCKEFYERFLDDLEWFDAHINLYRNDYIEHPFAHGLKGIVFSPDNAKIAGLVGTDFTDEEVALLQKVQRDIDENSTDTISPVERYLWVCRNLERIPPDLDAPVKQLIRRVGLESGDLNELAPRVARMFTVFLRFFGEWKDRPQN